MENNFSSSQSTQTTVNPDPLEKKISLRGYLFSTFFILSLCIAVIGSLFRFVYLKNFTVIIEHPCNSELDSCFVRDCSQGDCLPNELPEYKKVSIDAYSYDMCYSLDGCIDFCNSSKSCTVTFCTPETEECDDQIGFDK